jgi:starvation-inducible DNA-binding protein
MMKKERIEELSVLIYRLNDLLANYAIHYQNLRSMHWNVKGPHFFMLHQKFEEEYLDAQESVDEIAERILSLGGKPLSSFSVYLNKSKIEEFSSFDSAENAIEFYIRSLETLIETENNLLKTGAELNDEGTVALMSELIGKQEKNKWMFSSLIN